MDDIQWFWDIMQNAEGQGGHYAYLRSTPNFDCSKYEYDEPISDIDNRQNWTCLTYQRHGLHTN